MSSGDSGNVTNRFYVENWVYKGGVKNFHVRCLPPLYMYMSAVYLPSIYRGEVNSGHKKLILPLYIPFFTLISDLASDLGVTSGLFGDT